MKGTMSLIDWGLTYEPSERWEGQWLRLLHESGVGAIMKSCPFPSVSSTKRSSKRLLLKRPRCSMHAKSGTSASPSDRMRTASRPYFSAFYSLPTQSTPRDSRVLRDEFQRPFSINFSPTTGGDSSPISISRLILPISAILGGCNPWRLRRTC
jgi:hypothetical protein